MTGKLQKAVQTSLQNPELNDRLKVLDITADYATGSELQARVVRDIKNWSTFIESKGLKGR